MLGMVNHAWSEMSDTQTCLLFHMCSFKSILDMDAHCGPVSVSYLPDGQSTHRGSDLRGENSGNDETPAPIRAGMIQSYWDITYMGCIGAAVSTGYDEIYNCKTSSTL